MVDEELKVPELASVIDLISVAIALDTFEITLLTTASLSSVLPVTDPSSSIIVTVTWSVPNISLPADSLLTVKSILKLSLDSAASSFLTSRLMIAED